MSASLSPQVMAGAAQASAQGSSVSYLPRQWRGPMNQPHVDPNQSDEAWRDLVGVPHPDNSPGRYNRVIGHQRGWKDTTEQHLSAVQEGYSGSTVPAPGSKQFLGSLAFRYENQ